ncbi:MAG: methionine gamma-lyase family protein [Lachnospiraceae bacterium]|nr:methionine gamma-lyase family protein [Lachnospiraceae bacterium]
MNNYLEEVYLKRGISKEVFGLVNKAEASLEKEFKTIDEISEINQLKVLNAMQDVSVNTECLGESTGYGYDDYGRETLEKLYAKVFKAEAALVRPSITCGTHALTIVLSAILRPGDILYCPAGRPYDTLEGVIGLKDENPPGSLKEFNIGYLETPLKDDDFNYPEIEKTLKENKNIKLIEIQRSKGYDARTSFTIKRMGELIEFIRKIREDLIIMVDNCYGEFVELSEPIEIGADVIAGSLIKNPGGGLAPIGGYIAGNTDLIELCANRLTSPGLGAEVGATLGLNRSFFQGFFMSPVITANALKAAVLAAKVYEELGFVTIPPSNSERTDIIQAVKLGKPEYLIAFCKGIQAGSAVDSNVLPEPYPMPGYHSDVIMAAGAFIQGSSIELSADGPLEEPYCVYFQGGLTYPSAKFGISMSVQALQNVLE